MGVQILISKLLVSQHDLIDPSCLANVLCSMIAYTITGTIVIIKSWAKNTVHCWSKTVNSSLLSHTEIWSVTRYFVPNLFRLVLVGIEYND